jgi:hypothetical protein
MDRLPNCPHRQTPWGSTGMKKEKAKPKNPPLYSPTAEERAAIEKAFEERKIAPAPRIKVKGNEITIDHPSDLIGHLLMQNALGSLDSAFAHGLLYQMAGATSGGSNVNESDLNFMVSFIKGIEPLHQGDRATGSNRVHARGADGRSAHGFYEIY